MCVVLVRVLPPAAIRVHVGMGDAPPVDEDLKAGQATATLSRTACLARIQTESGTNNEDVARPAARPPMCRLHPWLDQTVGWERGTLLGNTYTEIGPVVVVDDPHVHAEKASDESTHAGVGPLEEVRPGGVNLDPIEALIGPAALAAAAAAHPQVPVRIHFA